MHANPAEPLAVSSESTERKTPYILIIDDDPNICGVMHMMLSRNGYRIEIAEDGNAALAKLAQETPDLICLDMYLPDISGLELLHLIRADGRYHRIPVIMVTISSDPELKLKCLNSGANDFLNKPLDFAELTARVSNLIRVKNYHDLLNGYKENLERQVSQKTDQIKRFCVDTVMTLTRAAEFRDKDTGSHVARISHYARAMAQDLGMDQAYCEHIFYASPMHDIGKLAIPDHILLKRSSLSTDEWAVMKRHAQLGKEILRGHGSPYLEMGQAIAASHHEYWDGSGYPQGLKGEAIPLSARIVALADVYDALRSKRPYKSRCSHSKAVEVITRGDQRTRPEQFDPELLNRFVAMNGAFDDIYTASTKDINFDTRY